MTTDSTGEEYPKYIWNYAVHEKGNEQLYFWRLGFYPSFVSEDVVPAIDEVMWECGIQSVVLYELFGIHDLLLRVWIPANCSVERFRKTLLDRLAGHSLKTCDPFIVKSPVRHWLFPNGQPAEEAVERLTQEKIDAVEEDSLKRGDIAVLKGERLIASFPSPGRSAPPIKFAVVVVGEPRLGVRQLEQFERTITEVLDKANDLEQRSLYSGFGFGHFLILGAVPERNFYSIDAQLITKLNEAHIQQVYDSRTYTYISGVPRYLRFKEGLSQPERVAPSNTTADEESLLPDPDRFRLLSKLGEGGFAPVFHVYDKRENEEWAMKVFTPEHASAASREIQALRMFDDPRIVKVISIHEEASTGRSYLLMEYIEGVALDKYVDGNPIDDRFALKIATSLLDALSVIHPDQTQIDALKEKTNLSQEEYKDALELKAKALVHRDIKPANIVLLEDGSIKLIDFNISSPPGALVRTRSGTPRYQPPDATDYAWDVSTDLFAAGIILYELICGVHPYPNDEPRADREPIDPRERRPDLSYAFAEFLIKSCKPRRADRFKTAREMQKALAQVTATMP